MPGTERGDAAGADGRETSRWGWEAQAVMHDGGRGTPS